MKLYNIQYNDLAVEKNHYLLLLFSIVLLYIAFIPLFIFEKYIILSAFIFSILLTSRYCNSKFKNILLLIYFIFEILDSSIIGISVLQYIIMDKLIAYCTLNMDLNRISVLSCSILFITSICKLLEYCTKILCQFNYNIKSCILSILCSSILSIILIKCSCYKAKNV